MSEEKIITQPEITEQDVWDVMRFAQEATGGMFFPSVFNPLLTNERMKDITLNPLEPTEENVSEALSDPKSSEDKLISYSEHFELVSMIYKRMINYLGNLLSFDLTYTPLVDDEKDFKSAGFKRDRKIVHEFLDKFNLKKEFKTIMKQLFRQEAFFGIFRDEGERYTIQELPQQYCKITGRWDYGLLYSFNFNWFLNGGVDIGMYPDIFKTMYLEVFKDNNDNNYLPSLPPQVRGKSSFAYWKDCSPLDGFWAFKLSPEVATRIPYLSALFPDLVLQSLIRVLQKDQNVISATKIIFGEVPLISDSVKGSVTKDQVAVSPDLLGKFLALLKAGLYNAIKVASAPLEDVQAISFPLEDRDMYDSYLKTTTASSGLNSRLIFSTEKPTALESQLSVDVDEYLVKYVYPFFEDFLEYQINKRTKKYKFKFHLEGTEFSTDRKERLEVQMKLLEKGIVLPQKISASIGMSYPEFERQLKLGIYDDFSSLLTPIVSSYNIGKNDTGRPQKDISDLSESGQQTRDDAENLNKGGNI